MSRSVILAFLSALAVMAVVSGTVEDTFRRVVDVLADASFEEWSATFIETNDKIAFSDQRSSSQTSRPTCPVAKTDTRWLRTTLSRRDLIILIFSPSQIKRDYRLFSRTT
ncbi:unnamed protein product [Brassica oleracea]